VIDALDEAGLGRSKDALFSRLSQLWTIASMAGAIAGTHLAAIRLTLPWMVGFSSYVLCAVVAAHAMRLEKARNQPPLLRDVAASVTQRVSEAVRPGIRSRTILLLSISEGLRSAARKSYWQEWPRYFTTHLHSRIAAIGYFYCAFSIAGVAGAEAANLLAPNERARRKCLR